MDITQYEFHITLHAYSQAEEREVTPDMIEATLKGGRIIRFGKNNLKFVKEYRRFTVICVDQVIGTTIRIVTVETKGRR